MGGGWSWGVGKSIITDLTLRLGNLMVGFQRFPCSMGSQSVRGEVVVGNLASEEGGPQLLHLLQFPQVWQPVQGYLCTSRHVVSEIAWRDVDVKTKKQKEGPRQPVSRAEGSPGVPSSRYWGGPERLRKPTCCWDQVRNTCRLTSRRAIPVTKPPAADRRAERIYQRCELASAATGRCEVTDRPC
jgi:hypothetical protein